MKMPWIYLKAQLHRMLRRFPVIFLVTLLMLAGLVGLAWVQFESGREDDEFESVARQKVSVAIVGDTSESYLGIGIYAVEHMDSTRFTVNFIECSEPEARKMLQEEKIEAFLLVPEGFLDSISSAENKPITLVIGGNQGGIGTELVRELADMISRVLTSSQTTIYAMRDTETALGKTENQSRDVANINLQYFDLILAREEMYRKETVEAIPQLNRMEYYLCAAVVLFLLLWGMNGTLLLTSRDLSLPKVLKSRRLGPVWQVTLESFSYSLLLLLTLSLTVFLLLFGVRKAGLDFALPGPAEENLSFLLAMLPIVFSTAQLQYLLCQLSDSPIVNLLMMLIVSLVLGYLSGCFYFLSYFPEEIQRLAGYLPTGMQLQLLQNSILHLPQKAQLSGLGLYTGIFWLCSCLIRGHKLKK